MKTREKKEYKMRIIDHPSGQERPQPLLSESSKGSLAARLADTLMNEIVTKCDCGIDLHTGAIHRPNLPQVRVNLDTEGSENLGKAFNVPVVLDSKLRDGSLREEEILGFIVDPFGGPREMPITTEEEGIVIGKNNLPLVNEGDTLFHIARSRE